MEDNLTSETIHISEGTSATITLKGLPTAGYTWSYTVRDNPSLVTISKDIAGTNDKAKQGGDADVTFTITGNKTGKAIINFFQKRSWNNSDAVNEKDVTVIVA